MDVEAEVDRRFLCEKIVSQIDMASAKQAMLSQSQLIPSAAAAVV